MIDNFDKSFHLLLQSEGGWVDNPKDPGGETNLGVTKAVWTAWVGHPVDTMKNITPEMVRPLYKSKYWNPCYCDVLPIGLDYLLFDFGVNSGPGRSVKTLQSALGCVEDGQIGPNTMSLIKQADVANLINKFTESKVKFYEGLKTFSVFGKGWLARCDKVKTQALEMLNGN